MILQLVVIHFHTKFGYKRLGGPEDMSLSLIHI